MGFNATLEVKTGVDLKIEGLIGNATSLPFNKTVPANERMISTNIVGENQQLEIVQCQSTINLCIIF